MSSPGTPSTLSIHYRMGRFSATLQGAVLALTTKPRLQHSHVKDLAVEVLANPDTSFSLCSRSGFSHPGCATAEEPLVRTGLDRRGPHHASSSAASRNNRAQTAGALTRLRCHAHLPPALISVRHTPGASNSLPLPLNHIYNGRAVFPHPSVLFQVRRGAAVPVCWFSSRAGSVDFG